MTPPSQVLVSNRLTDGRASDQLAEFGAVEWVRSRHPVAYDDAVAAMEARVAAIHDGVAREAIWLLEHPPLYTAGTGAKLSDLIAPDRLPVYRSGRGGQFTYHGPGQRIAYVMLDLRRRGRDVRAFVHDLEEVAIRALATFGVAGERRQDRIGVWVVRPDGSEEKIAALGVRVRRWVSYHGLSFNVAPDLSHYAGIVPCGIAEHGVTSLAALGVAATMEDVDEALATAFADTFAVTNPFQG